MMRITVIILLLALFGCNTSNEVFTYKAIGVNNSVQITYLDIDTGQYIDTIVTRDLYISGYSFGLTQYHIYCSDPTVDLYFIVNSDGYFFADKAQLELHGFYKFE